MSWWRREDWSRSARDTDHPTGVILRAWSRWIHIEKGVSSGALEITQLARPPIAWEALRGELTSGPPSIVKELRRIARGFLIFWNAQTSATTAAGVTAVASCASADARLLAQEERQLRSTGAPVRADSKTASMISMTLTPSSAGTGESLCSVSEPTQAFISSANISADCLSG